MGKPVENNANLETDEEEVELEDDSKCPCWIHEGSPTLRYFRLMPVAIGAVEELKRVYNVEDVIWEQAKLDFILSYRDFIDTITKCAREIRE